MKKGLNRLLILALLLGLVWALGLGQGGDNLRNLSVDDYFRIQDVYDPQISPDGQWVAFVISTTYLEKDKSESRIWMLPVEGGEAIPMTAKGPTSGLQIAANYC